MGDLPPIFAKLKAFSEMFTEDEIMAIMQESDANMDDEIDFESFLRVSQKKDSIDHSIISVFAYLVWI